MINNFRIKFIPSSKPVRILFLCISLCIRSTRTIPRASLTISTWSTTCWCPFTGWFWWFILSPGGHFLSSGLFRWNKILLITPGRFVHLSSILWGTELDNGRPHSLKHTKVRQSFVIECRTPMCVTSELVLFRIRRHYRLMIYKGTTTIYLTVFCGHKKHSNGYLQR